MWIKPDVHRAFWPVSLTGNQMPYFIATLRDSIRENGSNWRSMANNNSSNPGQETDQTVTGTSTDDQLTGGLGNDEVVGGAGDDVLVGDGPIAGAWHYETFDYNFSSAAGQAFDFGSDPAERTGSGYVTDFNESNLTNTVNGTAGNPSDFGVIYTSTLNVTAGGTYSFATRSDDGSTIQIFDSAGNAVEFENQDGSTADFMNNDFHQAATTRTGDATLDAGETYTIQIRYWENAGGDELSATVTGPDTGGVTDNLLTTDMLGPPPGPDYSTTGVPAGIEGDDTIYGGGGNDTISGNGGDDTLFGDEDGPGGVSDELFDVEYYELGGAPGSLAAAGFDSVGTNSNTPTNTFLGSDLDVGGISLANGGDRETYAVRFETTLTVTDGGTYTFTTTSDDGSKLFIDGVEIVDNDGLHGAVTETGSTFLAPGDYTVVIIFFENGGGDSLSATISGDDTGNVPIDITTADIAAPSAGSGGNLPGNDVIDGGDGDDFINAGAGEDTQTGGDGNDTFIEVAGDGADTITDFNVGNTGSITDGDQSNNDFVDLSGFYNATTVANVNAAGGAFGNPIGMLRADAADGQIDGIIGGVDYSAEIGDVDLTLENGGTAVTGTDITFDNTNVICFAAGTMIETDVGLVPVETLKPGQMVRTAKHGLRPVRWLGRRDLSTAELEATPKLRPVRIAAGALGHGLPKRDLVVSRQHRMVVSSKIANRVCGVSDVLIAAIKLTEIAGIAIANDIETVSYFHVLFDNHEVIFAEGAPTESFYTGDQALRSIPSDTLSELLVLFPALRSSKNRQSPAMTLPAGCDQKALIARHAKNAQPLLQTWV